MLIPSPASYKSLDRLGVVVAIRTLTQKLIDLKQIQVEFTSNLENRFDKNREKALFRIFQELINNTLKHSSASKVLIKFDEADKKLHVSYEENGKGFDLKKQTESQMNKGFGLKSIESRIAFLNGQSHLHSAPGEGLQFTLSIVL